MRLIDADALFKTFEKTAWYNNMDRDEIAEEILLQMPTIDAVPVVRCRDCKHRKTDECPRYRVEIVAWLNEELMPEWDEIERDSTKDDGYCDCGER